MSNQNHNYALIMAGGGGTRLWPLSRQKTPKQVLPLVDDEQSMFEMTVRRLQPWLSPDHVYVVTGQDMVEQLRADVPEIPAENFIIEPFGRNSGPAAALGTLAIMARDPEAVIATLPADHFIANTERFRQVLAAACTLARRNTIVTLGISPSRPATEFGYIKRGGSLGVIDGFECYQAENFTEKPNFERAIAFLKTGLYSWNSGMFIWPGQLLLDEFKRQQPAMYELFEAIRPHIGKPDFVTAITPIWQQMPSISLDYAVMEHAASIAVIPVDIGWSDVGSWDALYEVLPSDTNGNIAHGKHRDHIHLDTEETLVVSNRMVVTIGVNQLVVIDTEDVLMICHKDRVQDVREVVRLLREQGAESYL
ncbi:MAG: mannose-1-phosphate guanylyltransferase [Anaerolineae bacterium]